MFLSGIIELQVFCDSTNLTISVKEFIEHCLHLRIPCKELTQPTDRQAIYTLKLRNIHHNKTTRIKNLQKKRLSILL